MNVPSSGTGGAALLVRSARTVRLIGFGSGVLLAGHLAAADVSCNESAGPVQAHRYVEQCLEVSPATHPPCNAANACTLILDEIRRGCAFLGKDGPPFCRPYQQRG
jgi:hypothetical protein